MRDTLIMTLRNFENKESICRLIEEKFEKLKRVCREITKCHVLIDRISRSHNKGNVYVVELQLKQSCYGNIFVSETAKEGDISLEAAVRRVFKKIHDQQRSQMQRERQKIKRTDMVILSAQD